jgi:hypothetical protein
MSKKIITFESEVIKEVEIKEFKPPKPKGKPGRTYKTRDRIIYGPYLEDVFLNNEYEAYSKEAKTDRILKRDFLEKNKNNYQLKQQFKNHKLTIGMFRTRFNKGILHANQEPNYLLSICYDEFSHPVAGGMRQYQYLSFEEVYQKCVEYKIADPRFVPLGLIKRIKDKQNSGDPDWLEWRAPPLNWIERFEKKIGKTAYNSLKFPRGWTREETPIEPGQPPYYSD